MKLTTDSITSLQKLITVAQIAAIDNVIIEEGKIRGISEDKSVVLFAEDNIPDFGYPRIGLNRLDVLSSRLSLAKDSTNLVIDSKQGRTDQEVGMLDISWTGAKVGYRCADPSIIRAPKNVRDTDTWEVEIQTAQVPTIINALKSMGSKRINLNTRTGNEVYLELVDTNQDAFTLKIADGAEYLKEDDPKSRVWVHIYPASQLVSILRAASEGVDSFKFVIGENGTLQIKLHNAYKLIVVSLTDTAN